jgi:RNA polymerase sigma factor (sigma-70 family)
MAEDQEWQRLIAGLRAGDPQIETEFWDRHGEALCQLTDRYLRGRQRARVDADDIALSAMRTFLRRARLGEFTLPDSDSLRRLLCAIALVKLRQHLRFHLRQKRGLHRETPLANSENSSGDLVITDRNPLPDEAVVFADQMRHLLDSLAEDERQIVELKLQDLTNEEVAGRLQCSERTVRRILKRIETGLRRKLSEG